MLNYLIRCLIRIRYHIYTNYLLICTANFLCFILISGLYIFFIYQSYFRQLDQDLLRYKHNIEYDLVEILDDAKRLSFYAGKSIVNINAKPHQIFHLLNTIANTKHKLKEAITVFEWSTSSNQCILNSEVGLLIDTIDITSRSYTTLCHEDPWKVHFGPPVRGITTQLWVIPGGIGITDKHGKYVGTITFGINIHHLIEKISKNVPVFIKFLLLDKNHNCILDSHLTQNEIHFNKSLKNINFPAKEKKGKINFISKDNNTHYTHFTKLDSCPYTLLVGYDKDLIKNDILTKNVPRLLDILFYCLVFISFLYFFHRKINKLYQKTNNAQREYVQNIQQALQENIKKISSSTSELANLTNSIGNITESTNIAIKRISKASNELKSVNLNTPHFKRININLLIQDCILIYSQNSLIGKKQIEFFPVSPSPELKVDVLGFKRMILGFISLLLKSLDQQGNLVITTQYDTKEDLQKYLVITFKDTGFALSLYEIQKLSKHLNEWNSDPLIGTDIEIYDILKIIERHSGLVKEDIHAKNGKIITLAFPLSQNLASNISSYK